MEDSITISNNKVVYKGITGLRNVSDAMLIQAVSSTPQSTEEDFRAFKILAEREGFVVTVTNPKGLRDE